MGEIFKEMSSLESDGARVRYRSPSSSSTHVVSHSPTYGANSSVSRRSSRNSLGPNDSILDDADRDILFEGKNARLTQFSVYNFDPITGFDNVPPQDNRTSESVVAEGPMHIYRILGKEASFLACGSKFVHPILKKLRLWRTGSHEFIMPQPNLGKYWKIELLHFNYGDIIDDLEGVLESTCNYRNTYFPASPPEEDTLIYSDDAIVGLPKDMDVTEAESIIGPESLESDGTTVEYNYDEYEGNGLHALAAVEPKNVALEVISGSIDPREGYESMGDSKESTISVDESLVSSAETLKPQYNKQEYIELSESSTAGEYRYFEQDSIEDEFHVSEINTDSSKIIGSVELPKTAEDIPTSEEIESQGIELQEFDEYDLNLRKNGLRDSISSSSTLDNILDGFEGPYNINPATVDQEVLEDEADTFTGSSASTSEIDKSDDNTTNSSTIGNTPATSISQPEYKSAADIYPYGIKFAPMDDDWLEVSFPNGIPYSYHALNKEPRLLSQQYLRKAGQLAGDILSSSSNYFGDKIDQFNLPHPASYLVETTAQIGRLRSGSNSNGSDLASNVDPVDWKAPQFKHFSMFYPEAIENLWPMSRYLNRTDDDTETSSSTSSTKEYSVNGQPEEVDFYQQVVAVSGYMGWRLLNRVLPTWMKNTTSNNVKNDRNE